MQYDIILPSPVQVIEENETRGVYEINGLHPGYGYTLGPSLRRVLLSSLPGASITSAKIAGANHEFMTLPGIKEDVLTVLLNLKQVRIKMHTDEPQQMTLSVKGQKTVTAGDFRAPTQVEIANKNTPIATLTTKDAALNIEVTVEKGLGYIPREMHSKEKVGVGVMPLDATMTPIKRVNYEVENMRVGDRTDYNKLRFHIETDGTMAPNEALRRAIEILLEQLGAVIGKPASAAALVAPELVTEEYGATTAAPEPETALDQESEDPLKIRVEDLKLSSRTLNVLSSAGIRTVGGLVKKREEDLFQIEGFGKKSVEEIKRALGYFGLTLKN